MKCGSCGANLTHSREGPDKAAEVVVRTRGLVVKGGGLALICPKCKGDVHPTKAERDQLILFLKAS